MYASFTDKEEKALRRVIRSMHDKIDSKTLREGHLAHAMHRHVGHPQDFAGLCVTCAMSVKLHKMRGN